MRIEPLGERGLILQEISKDGVRVPAFQVAKAFRAAAVPGLVDAVAAYDTVGLYFDREPCSLETIDQVVSSSFEFKDGLKKRHSVPVCYEIGDDFLAAAKRLRLQPEKLIDLHASTTFLCYAVGFCPGFPYLGYLPDGLCGLPRLDQPRVRVEPGSIGITGKQTGIYPLATPGGWWLIGRTPLEIVNLAEGYFPIEAGDSVSFFRIDEREFERRKGERL